MKPHKMRQRHARGGLFSGRVLGFGRSGGGGFDDNGFSRGRKFSSEDLQVLLVDLLVREPRHGYELIRLLEARSNGFYTPSPGMVYPALTYLEETGYTTVATEGNRKRYALTGEGRAYVDANRERIDLIWAKLNFFAQKMGLVRRALAGDAADRGDGDRDGGACDGEGAVKHPLEALMHARSRIKQLLTTPGPASPEQQLRIAEVLERAAAEIAAIADSTPQSEEKTDD